MMFLAFLSAPVVTSPPWLPPLVGGIILLFGGGAWVAYLRLRKESPNIVVSAAQGAVIVQSKVIDDLQEQIDALRTELQDATRLRARVRELEQREEHLTAENTRLRSQVADLQRRVQELEGNLSQP